MPDDLYFPHSPETISPPCGKRRSECVSTPLSRVTPCFSKKLLEIITLGLERVAPNKKVSYLFTAWYPPHAWATSDLHFTSVENLLACAAIFIYYDFRLYFVHRLNFRSL